MIALAGAAVGYLLAHWTVALISHSFFAIVPTTYGRLAWFIHPSWRVAACTIGLAVVSVVTFGLAPALQATSPHVASALKGEDVAFGSRVRRSRVRDWLVAVQVAGSLVLLVAAGTLVQGVRDVARGSSGLEPSHVLVASFGLSVSGHVPPTLARARAELASRAAEVSGVTATARAMQAPFTSWPLLHVAPSADESPLRGLPYNRITPGYFDVVGQRLIEGRAFSAEDSSTDAPVAIVTRAAATTLWPQGDAIGRSIRIAAGGDSTDRIVRVVGIASDAHSGTPWDSDASGYLYLPATSRDFSNLDMLLLVRADAGAKSVTRALADAAGAVDPNAPLEMQPLSAMRDLQVVPLRYGAMITCGVGLLGLALAIVGLYGVVAFAVRQRRRDIAVHVALGASTRNVLRLVLHRELRLVVIGLAAGLVMATVEARLIGSLTLPLAPLGVAGFIGVALLLLLVASLATAIPAAAALRVAPMQVLRQD